MMCQSGELRKHLVVHEALLLLCATMLCSFLTLLGEERERKERKYFTSITMSYLLVCWSSLSFSSIGKTDNLDN